MSKYLKKQSALSTIFVSLLLLSGVCLAVQSPVTLLDSATSKMIKLLKSHQQQTKKDPKVIEGYVKDIILPSIDVDSMVRQVLGRNGWNKSTPGQRAQFKREFQIMVIRSYSAAFSSFRDHTVRYLPLKEFASRRYVQVNSVITQKGGRAVRVNYRLVKHGDSWRVYDFSVDGISMVQSYRSQFAGVMQRQGIEGVISMVAKHNK